jgi:hypothetical protein
MNATPTAHRGLRLPGDEGLHIAFFLEANESSMKTLEQGHPVFDDCEMIEIRIPGDDKTILKSIVTREYQHRFPDEYAAFKANKEVAQTGTPLEHWAALTPSQIAMFKSQNIRTVEGLANVADGNATFMGSHDIRAKAKAFLKAAGDSAIVEKQESALAAQAAEMAELRAQIAALSEKKAK